MRPAIVITVIALLIGAGVIYYFSTLPGPFSRGAVDRLPSVPDSPGGGLTRDEENEILLAGMRVMGYGASEEGVRVLQDGEAAVFAFPNGREIRVEAPAGHRLEDRFAVPNPRSGGFFLEEPGGEPLYVNFADAGQRIEPPEAEEARFYRLAAERVAQEGALPFLQDSLAVVSAAPEPRAVRLCLEDDQGQRFEGGTRFVGPLSVSVMRVGDCDVEEGRITAHLDVAEAALAGNR